LQPLDSNGKAFGKLKIFCKGADSFVFKLLRGCASLDAQSADEDIDDMKISDSEKDAIRESRGKAQPDWNHTFQLLCEFGGESLRTLVVATSEKDPSWYGIAPHSLSPHLTLWLV
jgi:magnesium-transporting ATPase (P-type)